ncbi:MAG: SufD family Fe-S cluster assembly protein [Candidatus Micrarchaeota archaeon]|nr:SufD family Fe-S cluster assembly protein [Candidatus Micrarchaeota archaeon]
MATYEDFVKNAIEQYQKLPQETSELYKRYFVAVPFELMNYIGKGNGNAAEIEGIVDNALKGSIKFDVVLTSRSASSASEFAKIEEAGRHFNEGMHSNEEDKYVAFIQAYAKNVVVINVPKNANVKLNMLVSNSDEPLNTKIIVNVDENASLSLFEYYASTAANTSSTGAIHEIRMKADANAEINCLHNENDKTVVLAFCKNRIDRSANLRFNSVYNGGMVTRVRNYIDANSDMSNVDVTEIVFGSKTQKFDVATKILNAGKGSNASLQTKAALMDTSFCIMKGYAKIARGASNSRSYVHERGILLDKGAKVDGLPDMSVDENNVKATHSSATAPVDADTVFYLMSKGINETGVKKLIVNGFFSSELAKISNMPMKELSMAVIKRKLETKGFGETPEASTKDIWVVASDVNKDGIFKGHYKYRE